MQESKSTRSLLAFSTGSSDDGGFASSFGHHETKPPPRCNSTQAMQDSIAFRVGTTGGGIPTKAESISATEKYSLQPPKLKRHVASCWGFDSSKESETITAAAAVAENWTEITKATPLSGTSSYFDYYTSEEEDIASELGKVTISSNISSPLRYTYTPYEKESSPNGYSYSTSPMGDYYFTASPASSSAAATASSVVDSMAVTANISNVRPAIHPPSPPAKRRHSVYRVDVDRLFETVKEAVFLQEQTSAPENVKDISMEQDEEDYDDEMELMEMNNASKFTTPDDDLMPGLCAVTPSPDILRMETSPRKTPTKECDAMQISPKKSPPSPSNDVFQAVCQPSPTRPGNATHSKNVVHPAPVPFLEATSPTFSYPPVVAAADCTGKPRGISGLYPFASGDKDRKMLPIPKIPTATSSSAIKGRGTKKEPISLRPRGGTFKAAGRKKIEYPLEFFEDDDKTPTTSNVTIATVDDEEGEPFEEMYRATSPIGHVLYAPMAGGDISAFATGGDRSEQTPLKPVVRSLKNKRKAKGTNNNKTADKKKTLFGEF